MHFSTTGQNFIKKSFFCCFIFSLLCAPKSYGLIINYSGYAPGTTPPHVCSPFACMPSPGGDCTFSRCSGSGSANIGPIETLPFTANSLDYGGCIPTSQDSLDNPDPGNSPSTMTLSATGGGVSESIDTLTTSPPPSPFPLGAPFTPDYTFQTSSQTMDTIISPNPIFTFTFPVCAPMVNSWPCSGTWIFIETLSCNTCPPGCTGTAGGYQGDEWQCGGTKTVPNNNWDQVPPQACCTTAIPAIPTPCANNCVCP